MSDYSAIAAAIKAKIESITGAGKVHTDTPRLLTWEDVKRELAYTTAGGQTVIRAWFIRRTRVKSRFFCAGVVKREYTFACACVFGYADGITTTTTEAEFQQFMEDIAGKLEQDYSISNSFEVITEGPEITIDPAPQRWSVFGCHTGAIIIRGEVEKVS